MADDTGSYLMNPESMRPTAVFQLGGEDEIDDLMRAAPAYPNMFSPQQEQEEPFELAHNMTPGGKDIVSMVQTVVKPRRVDSWTIEEHPQLVSPDDVFTFNGANAYTEQPGQTNEEKDYEAVHGRGGYLARRNW